MSGFPFIDYRENGLNVEAAALTHVAEKFGTPCYVYSRAALMDTIQTFNSAFAGYNHLICYAVKANSNLAILNLLSRAGCGFDIVSGGELQRVIKAGGDPQKTVFSGVGKSSNEMRMALAANILCFNVESETELLTLNQVANEMNKVASVSLRVNPDVDAKTHPYISTGLKENKFGVSTDEAERIYLEKHNLANIHFSGLDCHIGSQLTELAPFIQASNKLLDLLDRLEAKELEIDHLDFGGGLGIRYTNETPPSINEYVTSLCTIANKRNKRILIEPGRSLIGNAGLLLSRVEYIKHTPERNFAIIDAAMNDLLRPALYNAYHEILPVTKNKKGIKKYQIVGPVCETGDFLGHDRNLCLANGDLLAVMSAGAYGMSMSSNYNTRPRAAEVMVDGNNLHLIRARESFDQLIAGEKILQ